jgi:hypothetical protein
VDYGLKIAINATFGLLKNEYSFNHDPNLFYAITINGQLMLLDLIEKFYLTGIEVLSANTDGVLIRVKDDLQNAKMEIIENWQEQTGMDLEQSIYKKFVQRDVNNYIAQTVKGSVKFKGLFNIKPRLDQEINAMIIPLALKAYFIDGVSVEEFISNPDNDIHDYVVYQNINKKTFRFMEGGKELPPVSRFIHTTNGYKVFKVKKEQNKRFIGEGGSGLAFHDGCLLELANDLSGCVTDYPQLNIDWYVFETQKIINLIENEDNLKGIKQSSFL